MVVLLKGEEIRHECTSSNSTPKGSVLKISAVVDWIIKLEIVLIRSNAVEAPFVIGKAKLNIGVDVSSNGYPRRGLSPLGADWFSGEFNPCVDSIPSGPPSSSFVLHADPPLS
jgi:hypothetical protein